MTPKGQEEVSRRQFVRTAAWAGVAASAPMIVPSSVLGQRSGAIAPSDKVVVGGIGLGFRGSADLRSLLGLKDARFTAICDVKNSRREEIKSLVDKAYDNHDCAMYSDQFELLSRDDIDAVLIAPGDRWHTPLAVLAAKHGKDVYCEKPGAVTIAQAIALREIFQRYGRIYQAGSQRHSSENTQWALHQVHTGKLGKIHTVHAKLAGPPTWPPTPNHGWLPPEPEPPKQVLDWDRWLGPAPWRPYNSTYVARGEGGWYNFWDLHCGGILEWGPHSVDLAAAGADSEDMPAIEYIPQGTEKGPYSIECRYPNGVKLVMRDSDWLPSIGGWARFEGEGGWIEGGGARLGVSDNLKERFDADIKALPSGQSATETAHHIQNWLEAVKTRTQPRCGVQSAANTLITCHAAYVAWQLGRKLTWDIAANSFVNDDEANRMRSRAMRAPWNIL